ncbi:MAG: Coq4 family protein [Gammaproteobacteria bacterium]|nr:Coq4 family protein [Gammaproteobacteria bacterium]
MTDWTRKKNSSAARDFDADRFASTIFDDIRTRMSRLKKAWVAVRALFEDPEDTEQVFRVVSALRGRSLERAYMRFRSTDIGNRILLEDIDLLSSLRDREFLNTHNEGTLAQAYLKFVRSGDLTADGLVEASYEATENIEDRDLLRYLNRIRDMHDLWHTLTQYGREPLGEACLLAFTYAQMKNPGTAFIVVLGSRRLARGYGRGTIHALWRAYRDGKRASWLAAQPFEKMLATNVQELRSMLSIPEPTAYWLVLEQHGLR